MPPPVDLSIVVPAYNEEARIGPTLDRISEFLLRRGGCSEIIVVDDGSSDCTVERVEAWRHKIPGGCHVRLLQNGLNRGKGFSVRRGILDSSGCMLLFTDADLSAPIEEAPKLLGPVARGEADVAIGSRALEPSLVGTHQSALRELAGRSFNRLVRWVTGLRIRDTQCGFKAFSRSAASSVFPWTRLDRFGFDVEVLYLTRKLGLRVLEVPVVWNHAERSKVRLLPDGANMLGELVRIRWYEWKGCYPASTQISPGDP